MEVCQIDCSAMLCRLFECSQRIVRVPHDLAEGLVNQPTHHADAPCRLALSANTRADHIPTALPDLFRELSEASVTAQCAPTQGLNGEAARRRHWRHGDTATQRGGERR